jgi:hypothetical protein
MIVSNLEQVSSARKEATRVTMAIRDRINQCAMRTDVTHVPKRSGTRFSRIRAIHALARHREDISLGFSHDRSWRVAAWAHFDNLESNGSYHGVAVTHGAINYQPEFGQPCPSKSSKTNIMIDLSVMRSLVLSLGATGVRAQAQFLRPVIAWCALAYRIGAIGRFMVPVPQGLFICQAGQLPVTTKDGSVMGARVMAFHSMKDMRKNDLECWRKLQNLHIIDETPEFPHYQGFCVSDAKRLSAMMDLELTRLRDLKPYPAALGI